MCCSVDCLPVRCELHRHLKCQAVECMPCVCSHGGAGDPAAAGQGAERSAGQAQGAGPGAGRQRSPAAGALRHRRPVRADAAVRNICCQRPTMLGAMLLSRRWYRQMLMTSSKHDGECCCVLLHCRPMRCKMMLTPFALARLQAAAGAQREPAGRWAARAGGVESRVRGAYRRARGRGTAVWRGCGCGGSPRCLSGGRPAAARAIR